MLLDGSPFRLGPFRANGFSVSSRATWITLPTFDLGLDLGWCVEAMRDISRVFISHLHQDHCAGLPIWLDWRQSAIEAHGPPRVYLPAPSAEPARRWLEAAAVAQHMPNLRFELVPMAEGDRVDLGGHFVLEAFETTHHVPTIGALIAQRLRHLKPAFQHLTSDEVSQLFERGVDIHDLELRPLVAYTSDTTPEVFERRPDLLRAQVLIVECSLVEGALVDGTRTRSTRGERPELHHCHIRPLSRALDAFEGEHLILCHTPPHLAHADMHAFFLPRLAPRLRSKLAVVPHRSPSEPELPRATPSARPGPVERLPTELLDARWRLVSHVAEPHPPDAAWLAAGHARWPGAQPVWAFQDKLLSQTGLLAMVDASYLRFLRDQPELVQWLVQHAADVYGDAPQDREAGLDYHHGKAGRAMRFADVAVRRALWSVDRWFEGQHLVPICGNRSDGFVLDPGVVPFIAPEAILGEVPERARDTWHGSVGHFWWANGRFAIADDTRIAESTTV